MTVESALWKRYEDLVVAWNADQRERAITRYRRRHEPVAVPAPRASEVDQYPVTPAEQLPAPASTPDFTYRPVRLPVKPAEPTITDAMKWGVGGGAVVALVWFLMMAAGWKSGSGHIIPILIMIGLILGALGGATTAAIRYAVRRKQYQDRMPRYAAAAEHAAVEVNKQQMASEENRLAKVDDDADRLLWERIRREPAAVGQQGTAEPLPGVTTASDAEILAEFDAGTPDRIAEALAEAREAGTAPESTNGWLEATAASIKKTTDAIAEMRSRGWHVHVADSGDSRDVIVVESADIPAPTTVMFHHATPQQLQSAEEHIAVYDDASLSYRPIPGTNHEAPEGLPSRSVHVNTHWKTLGLDEVEGGYGPIGSDAYLTDWAHLISTIESAEL